MRNLEALTDSESFSCLDVLGQLRSHVAIVRRPGAVRCGQSVGTCDPERTPPTKKPPRVRPFGGLAGVIHTDRGSWSWGESNPRPTLSNHAFSGRSL